MIVEGMTASLAACLNTPPTPLGISDALAYFRVAHDPLRFPLVEQDDQCPCTGQFPLSLSAMTAQHHD